MRSRQTGWPSSGWDSRPKRSEGTASSCTRFRCRMRDSLAALTGDRPAGAHGQHERLAATVACKAAIKAGDELAPAEMRALVDALERTTLPAHDVHGRATIVRLSWDEVERRFGRR